MSGSVPPQARIAASTSLAETVALTALSLFGQMHLPSQPALLTEIDMTRQLQQQLMQPNRTWPELVEALEHRLPHLPGVLGRLVREFNLDAADFFMLGLCGAVESQHQTGMAIGWLQQPGRCRPEIHLVCNLCKTLFHKDITPVDLLQHPLLSSGLLTMEGDEALPMRRLKIAPLLWRLMNGHPIHWPGCRPLATPKHAVLPESMQSRCVQTAKLLASGRIRGLVLRGETASGLLVAGTLAEDLGLQPMVIDAETVLDRTLALLARYGRWFLIVAPRLGPGERWVLPEHLAGLPAAVLLGRDGSVAATGFSEIELEALSAAQRQRLWQVLLPDVDSRTIAASAHLSAPAIIEIAEQASLQALQSQTPLELDHVLQGRFIVSADHMRVLAQPVTRRVDDAMLVLAADLKAKLQHLVSRCQKREVGAGELGPTLSSNSGIGVRALFIGESGTGKTLAASYLASRLQAPLYRVDLAAVMNKYIGETEKNLGRLFDHAADHDVVLLLDEADALFGKRSDGGETGERFANMLTNFLLTRIEQHPGIIVLTSNSQARIDKAFMRRLDAVLEFPLPDNEQRRQLWQSHLGMRAPDGEFITLLAQHCELPGGYIRNAVLNAAVFESEQAAQPLTRHAVLQALQWEYQKLGRQMPPQLERFRRL